MNEATINTVAWQGSKAEGKTQLAENWQFLVGCEVEVRRGRCILRTGLIDAATEDGNIVWLSREGVFDRRLMTRSEGCDIWITKLDYQRVLARMSKE